MQEVKGELTRELALKLTFIMWEDMAEAAKKDPELNDSPDRRYLFKQQWLEDRGFYDEYSICKFRGACLLCEYADQQNEKKHYYLGECWRSCPITWGPLVDNMCYRGVVNYRLTPIDKFLEYMKTHIKEEE